MQITRSGMVSLVGRPNVGKSTLMNALVGNKIAIVSDKPQTTRNRICAVVVNNGAQIVFLDTPGFHKAQSKLGQYMVQVVRESVDEVDCVLLLVEPVAHVGTPESKLLERISELKTPCMLVINKIDTIKKEELLEIIAVYSNAYNFEAIIPLSAQTGEGLDILLAELDRFIPEGPQLFPDGMLSDQPERQLVAEIIREKLLLLLDREVPHGSAVEIEKMEVRDDGLVEIGTVIYCEKDSHKGIIIGHKGARLRRIGELARADIEQLLESRVFLETWVKVKENWRDNPSHVRNFGYE